MTRGCRALGWPLRVVQASASVSHCMWAALREACNFGLAGSHQPRARPEDRLSSEPLDRRGFWTVYPSIHCTHSYYYGSEEGVTSKGEMVIGFSSSP